MIDYYAQLPSESLEFLLLQAGAIYFLLVLALAAVANLVIALFQWLAVR